MLSSNHAKSLGMFKSVHNLSLSKFNLYVDIILVGWFVWQKMHTCCKRIFHLNIKIISVYENIFCSFNIDGVCWYLSLSSPKFLPVVNPLVSVDPQTWTFLWQQIKAAGFQMLYIISIILKKSQRTTKTES